MEMTGMKFDLNPDTFTLQNMFAMELHKFQDVIGDITASATKELGIEKGISEVGDTWGAMKFTVSKFMKGTQERGFILGAVDEILQILDDNAMNLQSMSASRFVGPFLETVNKWEKSLSHIGEVVEVRIYGLLTKREVKMTGYRPSPFFACLWIKTESRSTNAQKKERGQYSTMLTEQTWSVEDLLYGFRGNFSRGTQPVVWSGQDSAILLSHLACSPS